MNGQLVSLTRFESKDPFAQQGNTVEGAAPSSGSSSSGTSSTPTASTPTPGTTPTGSTGGSFAPVPGTGAAGGSSTPTSATLGTISLNKVEMAVTVATDFPTSAPMFTLVSLTSKVAKIAIAGGSLATGSKTVSLPLGKSVTLMNTADGTRYEFIYLGLGDKTPPVPTVAVSTSGNTSTTATPATGTSTTAGRG
jgi:hypothetical protein